MKKLFFQLIRYSLVGVTATGVDYGAYYLLTRAFGLSVFVANPLSYVAGNIVSFLGHRFVTFRSRGRPLGEYVRFVVVTGLGLLISQLVLAVFVRLSVHDLIAKAASVILSGAFNFIANRSWTFRKNQFS